MTKTGCFVFCLAVSACLVIVSEAQATRSITYLGKTSDITNFTGMGDIGYYFPAFDAGNNRRRTDSKMKFSMPGWLDWEFNIFNSDRTFSPDAGIVSWSPFIVGVYATQENGSDFVTTPGGHFGRAGQAVDEAAAGNSNNTINKIHLGASTPSSFIMRVVLDTANGQNETRGELMARGASELDGSVDIRRSVPLSDLTFNNIPDVYSFRYDGFLNDDFIKMRLNSGSSSEDAAFSAIMFDTVGSGPTSIPEPASLLLFSLGGLGIMSLARRRR